MWLNSYTTFSSVNFANFDGMSYILYVGNGQVKGVRGTIQSGRI